ncbi:MAG: lamin tail domain-containing protein, partial [Tepidisphaeraceae bacterium]
WYSQTDGGGFSLSIVSTAQDLSQWSKAAGWQISTLPGGTPGYADTGAVLGSVVINEVLAHTDPQTQGDMIEFYNTTPQPVNMSGWFVSDDGSNLAKYEFANGTIIAAGGYIVLTQTGNFGNVADPGCHTAFALSEHGDDVYLSSNVAYKVVGQLTSSGQTATALVVSHGFHNGDTVRISGATQSQYNGDFTITNVTANSFDFTVSGSPVTPATGAIAAYDVTEGDALAAGGYREHVSLGGSPNSVATGLLNKSTGNGSYYAISSITLSGATATVTLNNAYPAFQNGQYVQISGAAQTQYDGTFLVAGVVVNSLAGTTTFTYTVSGSPSPVSPATPTAGQPLLAETCGSDFSLLETPTFGTPSAGGVYPGGTNAIPYVAPLVSDEIMYHPSAPTAAETAAGYSDDDFEYVKLYNPSSSPVSLADYYVAGGIGYTPGWLADGNLASRFNVSGITLSGTTATVTLGTAGSGLQNGDSIHIDGAAQTQYDGDFSIANVAVNSGAGTTTFTCTVNGSPASPATPVSGQSITAGKNSEFESLESGATATWSAAGLAAASYTVYAHLNLYDGDNNRRSDMDSVAQYTVSYGATQTLVQVNQDQVPATLSVTSLTYNNTSGLVTAAANNALANNNSLAAGSIVHISGATPSAYDGAFVVQSATPTSFTYSLSSGLNLAAATGTITAGLNDVWINLGTYTMGGGNQPSVTLTRTTAAAPSEWTVAGSMELVNQANQQTTVLGTPAFSSYSIQHPTATLAAGAYAVLVSNLAAFQERYGASNALVLGVYSGHLNNGGDTVDIYQVGNRDDGSVAPLNGYVPSYRLDHVNYQNSSPWPTRPDGNGPALMRIHAAEYGNDQVNWWASNAGGTPGGANIEIDSSKPSIPANLAGQGVLTPIAGINLAWSASSAPQSYVAYYNVYRNGT